MKAYVKKYQADGEYKKVEVKVGDYVGFKSDVEQSGRIKEIIRSQWDGSAMLVLENPNGFKGEYIGRLTEHTEAADDCWV